MELTDGYISNDLTVDATFKYYWDNYKKEFLKFPIIDTQGNINKTIELLEKYYNYGYKYFIGFSRSTILKEVLEWFDMHSTAIGISSTSSAPSLNIPKNIYRLTPTDDYSIEIILPKLYESPTVYYIYTEGEIAPLNILYILENNKNIKNLKTFAVNSVNMTVDSIKLFLDGSISEDSIVSYLLFYRDAYIDLYSKGLSFPGQQYDILIISSPIIPEGSIAQLTNKYNIIIFQGIDTSEIWRNGYYTLGENMYSIVSLNILNLLNYFAYNKSIENINSNFSILQFNPVTKDLIYPTFLIQIFIDGIFYNKFLSAIDPILGNYIAYLKDNIVPDNTIIPINNIKPYGKPIALLELTEYSNNIDTIYQQSLYFYWYNNPDFKPFPIIDTKSSIPYTLGLLDKYYNEGYRIFLGFSRSSVLIETLQWFNDHPDAIGISVWSTAIDLRIKKNIYRMEPSDNYIIGSITSELENARTVYYIYTGYELAPLNVLKILQDNPNINLKTYAIEKNNINLTVFDLNNFFIGSNEDDVTLLYIFDEQAYFNLYNETPPLTFPGNQYDVINTRTPQIYGTGQDILNNKLYYIQSISPNTSILWRKNAAYLTDEYKTETTSFGLCNALSMINHLLLGRNVGLLGSYSGVLQFDPITKDILYPSYLKRVYNKNVDNFVKSSLIFDDPLLGKFEAQFI